MKRIPQMGGLLLLLAGLMLSGAMRAQERDCWTAYLDAVVLFDAGRIDTAYQLLLSCMEDPKGMRNLDMGDKGRIYRLAADAASFLGYYDEAELHTMAFREVQPYYKVKEDDMPEFKANMEKIRIHPKNILTMAIAWPNTSPEMIRNLSPYTTQGEFRNRDDMSLIGIQYKRFVHPHIALGVGMQYGNILRIDMAGSSIPLKGQWKYHLGISAFEWPLVCDYYVSITESINIYFELGFNYRILTRSGVPAGPYFTKEKSELFGKYYAVSAMHPDYDLPTMSVAYFFEKPLAYDFIWGFGGSFRFRKELFEWGVRFFPPLVRNDPFKNVQDFDDIPESDPLHYYDDIFLLRIKNHFQMTVTLGYALRYKAY